MLAAETERLGVDHPDTLATRGQVAYYTAKGGDPAGALELYRELLTDRQRVLGPDHPDTLATRRGLHALEALPKPPVDPR